MRARPFREGTGCCPSLYGAEAEFKLTGDLGVSHTGISQGFHLLVDAVSASSVLLLGRCVLGESGCKRRSRSACSGDLLDGVDPTLLSPGAICHPVN